MKRINLNKEYDIGIIRRNIMPVMQLLTRDKLMSESCKLMLQYLSINKISEFARDVSNLWVCTKTKGGITIRIDTNKVILNMNSLNLCNIINDGNIEVRGTGVFDDVIDYVKDNFRLLIIFGSNFKNCSKGVVKRGN